jgi:hypothetical protein
MGHFSVGFLLGVAVGAYVAQEVSVEKLLTEHLTRKVFIRAQKRISR